MGIGMCLTDFLATGELGRVDKTEPTVDLIVLGWKLNAARALTVGTHAAAFMVLSEHAPWGTPPVMAIFARSQVAICVGSSRCAPKCLSRSSWHSYTLVLQSSFQLARVGERTNFGRFGAGIYTSATSSKVSLRCLSGHGGCDDVCRPTIITEGARLRIGQCF